MLNPAVLIHQAAAADFRPPPAIFLSRPHNASLIRPRALLVHSSTRSALPQLLAIKFHDQLFVDRSIDIFTLRQGQNTALQVLAIHFQPSNHRLVA